MARGAVPKTGNSKVRLIVFEAEISDGDLTQVTQAIHNALRPTQPPIRVVQQSASPRALSDDTDMVDVQEEVDEDPPVTQPARARQPRTSKPRVAKTPTVLDDIDVVSDPSLKDFVAEFDLSTAVDKYLVIALWFRDARGVSSISVDHVYTCFRLLGWSTSANDFTKPLRNLRDEQSFKGGSKDGFSLTLPGAGKIEAKKRNL